MEALAIAVRAVEAIVNRYHQHPVLIEELEVRRYPDGLCAFVHMRGAARLTDRRAA